MGGDPRRVDAPSRLPCAEEWGPGKHLEPDSPRAGQDGTQKRYRTAGKWHAGKGGEERIKLPVGKPGGVGAKGVNLP